MTPSSGQARFRFSGLRLERGRVRFRSREQLSPRPNGGALHMAIRDEESGSSELKRDARFHSAAVTADKRTEHLAGGVQAVVEALTKAALATEAADDARLISLARLTRADFELDERLRELDLDLLKAVSKNRKDPLYRAVLPNGLSAVVAMRGREQGEAVDSLVNALDKRSPELAKEYSKDLARLSKAAVDAETASSVFGEEVLARLDLVRQLQKNEGALLSLFPGQRRRVRSFYRPTRRRGAAPDDGAPEAEKVEG